MKYQGRKPMEEIKSIIEERESYLLQLKKEKEEALKKAPEGHLRVCQSGNRIQYYERTNPKDFNGVYLNDDNIKRAYELAQKDYDKKIIRVAEQELKAIQKYISTYPNKSVEQIYESSHKARQKLIIPIRETDEQFVERWQEVKYQGKEFYKDTPEFFTSKGERVRSKSEVIIADALNREGIPYRYEYPVYIKGIGKIYPDFMILNVSKRKEILWEHFGRMDDSEYVEKKFIFKMNHYENNGYFFGDNLICTFETRERPLNQKMVKSLIRRYFE